MVQTAVPQVYCRSGYTYAQRPEAVQIGSQIYKIVQISAEGRTPTGKWFQAITEDGRTFRLTYYLAEDCWTINGLE